MLKDNNLIFYFYFFCNFGVFLYIADRSLKWPYWSPSPIWSKVLIKTCFAWVHINSYVLPNYGFIHFLLSTFFHSFFYSKRPFKTSHLGFWGENGHQTVVDCFNSLTNRFSVKKDKSNIGIMIIGSGLTEIWRLLF